MPERWRGRGRLQWRDGGSTLHNCSPFPLTGNAFLLGHHPKLLMGGLTFIVCLSVLTTLPVPVPTRYVIHRWQITFTSVEDQLAGMTGREIEIDEEVI